MIIMEQNSTPKNQNTNIPSTNNPKLQKKLDEAKKLGLQLRNVLAHTKAYRWITHEWFYANIDRTLLAGENDFVACLRDTFPQLGSKKLTRTEWCKIRRLLGKPRRCSQAFLAEERALLSAKRQKIRQLQQQKVVDVSYYRDLPEQIPLSLVVGTKVTALLREPVEGLYEGVIDAVDTASHGYRITFDKSSIGTHTVPDYEVLTNDPPEFLPLNSFQTRIKPRMPILKSPKYLEILGHQIDEALGQGKTADLSNQNGLSVIPQTIEGNDESTGSQYPIRLLVLMLKISKILSFKRRRIYELKSMNDEVERLLSLDLKVPIELKKSYASIILDLEKLNNDLNDHLKAVQSYSNEMSIDTSCIPDPKIIKQKCTSEAKAMIDNELPVYKISNETSIAMINHMMSLILHLKYLSESDDNALQLKALNNSIREHKLQLSPDDALEYEDYVEIHVNYIKESTMHFKAQTMSKLND